MDVLNLHPCSVNVSISHIQRFGHCIFLCALVLCWQRCQSVSWIHCQGRFNSAQVNKHPHTCHVPNPIAGISAPVFKANCVFVYPAIVRVCPEICRDSCHSLDADGFLNDEIMVLNRQAPTRFPIAIGLPNPIE